MHNISLPIKINLTPIPATSDIDCDGDGVPNNVETNGPDGDPLTIGDNTDSNEPCDYDQTQVTLPQGGYWFNADCDEDGVTNQTEINGPDGDPLTTNDNTNPNDPCDYNVADITVTPGALWLVEDCDGDGVTNADEINGPDGDPLTTVDNTDPNNPCEFDATQITIVATSITDCDGDGVTNADEINGPDGDPLTTADNTDPNDPCEFNSTQITVIVTSVTDCDGDGVTNAQESTDGTDPNDPCDLIAENQTETPTAEWNDLDCDEDGLTNGEETTGNNDPGTPINPNGNITDPTNPDTDGDGVTDGNEADNETNPNDPCELVEANITETQMGDWLTADCDEDGVTNQTEITDGTNPNDPCDFIADHITLEVTTTVNCAIEIPEGFSPDNDGVNDMFVIEGIDNVENVNIKIMNRWGNRVYESDNYQNDWNGTNQFGLTAGSRDLPVGTYFYILDLGDGSDVRKGYIYLNR